jgi:hypothetical protein
LLALWVQPRDQRRNLGPALPSGLYKALEARLANFLLPVVEQAREELDGHCAGFWE